MTPPGIGGVIVMNGMDRFLAIFLSSEDGLYHGACYEDRPTPSGASRHRLSVSTTEGFAVASEAATLISRAFPELATPCTEGLDDLEPFPVLDGSAVVTLATPKDGSAKWIETCGLEGDALSVGLVERMILCGRLVPESSSGGDPELSARYDHYVAHH